MTARIAMSLVAGGLFGWLSLSMGNSLAAAAVWFGASPATVILLTRRDPRWSIGWSTVVAHWVGYFAAWIVLYLANQIDRDGIAILTQDWRFLGFLMGVHLAMHSAFMFVRQSVSGVADRQDVCRQCGYWLRGLPKKHRCPECGMRYDQTEVATKNSESASAPLK